MPAVSARFLSLAVLRSKDKLDQYIPKIIRQVYHNSRDPSNETILTDWGHTSNASRRFIETHCKWFLGTYDS
ncbi:hypothetical protein NEUTE2DRAFT_128533 [Neurospora tetrasperma FGSC 2509]|nr:hypothetical protein NEUTE2DRAFT_128533 [Neurospora tetrasperma FGSC 2509]